jgi:hypothetical protein
VKWGAWGRGSCARHTSPELQKGRRLWKSAFFVVLSLFLAVPVQASIHAWGCLLYASNGGKTVDLPARLAPYDSPLRKSLGYSNFRVIAQREIAIENQPENLLVSGGDIHVLLTSLTRESDGRYLVGLLFVEGSKLVMETQAKVGQGSPLFIRGPDWREGQIVIVFLVST